MVIAISLGVLFTLIIALVGASLDKKENTAIIEYQKEVIEIYKSISRSQDDLIEALSSSRDRYIKREKDIIELLKREGLKIKVKGRDLPIEIEKIKK